MILRTLATLTTLNIDTIPILIFMAISEVRALEYSMEIMTGAYDPVRFRLACPVLFTYIARGIAVLFRQRSEYG